MLVFPFFIVSLTCAIFGYLPYACGSRFQDYHVYDDITTRSPFGRENGFSRDAFESRDYYGWKTTAPPYSGHIPTRSHSKQPHVSNGYLDDDYSLSSMGHFWSTMRTSTTERTFLSVLFAQATTKRTYNAIEEPDRRSSSEDRELATGLGPRLGTTHKPQFPADPFNGGKNKLEKTSQEKKLESRAEKWCKRNTEGCTSFRSQVALGLRPRIIGGRAATPKKRTFMVLIGYGSRRIRHWLCGGSLVSNRYVLTAAHCTEGGTLGKAKWVRVGELDLSSKTDDAQPQDREIAERIRHPDYKEPAVYNDIALLKLATDVTFNEWVKPICLYPATSEPEPTDVIVTGWGRTDFASETSPMLLEVRISLFNNSACVGLMGRTPDKMRLPRGIDAESMVCAGDVNGGKDACTGDSGGPLFLEEDDCVTRQLGITSLGKDCGIPGTAGIYTNVTKYIPWIESIVWNDED